LSINKAVISLLEEHLGIKENKHAQRYHDLDALAGSWTEEAAAEFDAALAEQRSIDASLWGHYASSQGTGAGF
jgi:hypothetical protein